MQNPWRYVARGRDVGCGELRLGIAITNAVPDPVEQMGDRPRFCLSRDQGEQSPDLVDQYAMGQRRSRSPKLTA